MYVCLERPSAMQDGDAIKNFNCCLSIRTLGLLPLLPYVACIPVGVNMQLMRKQDFLERVIRRFIPPPILYVCEAEESGWFAEIGPVAVIFVNIAIKGLPGMDVMQSVFLVSEAIRRPGGSSPLRLGVPCA